MYECEVAARGRSDAIRQHLPRLVVGLAGSLLHGIIQLGYGYRLGGELPLAEGLAYLHYSYLPFASGKEETPDHWTRDSTKTKLTPESAYALLQDLINSIQTTADMLRAHLQDPVFADVVQGGLQRRLMSFSAHPTLRHHELHNLVVATVDKLDLHDVDGTFAIDFIAWLYLLAPQNDFVLLHGVTSAWALQQVEQHLSLADRERAWKVWFRVALSAFLTREIRELQGDVYSQLAQDESALLSDIAALPPWDELIATTLALGDNVDEHIIKFVQVMRDHAVSRANAQSFLTPAQRELLAKAAARKMLTVPLN
ncbi:hypothetical protein PINS_up015014 [Pythium insidiosum]|nr:hypothetical protein PINS_up015014 [Pythium insidiosum]